MEATAPVTREMCYFVKVLPPDKKVWYFLTPKGGMIRLRIHASIFRDKEVAEQVARKIVQDNADFKAKVVPWT